MGWEKMVHNNFVVLDEIVSLVKINVLISETRWIIRYFWASSLGYLLLI
jgi:hypothetical protein